MAETAPAPPPAPAPAPPTAPPPVPAEPVKLTGMKPADGVNTADKGSLRWPLAPYEISDDTDYVSFQFYNYKPPFGRGEGEEISPPDPDNDTGLGNASSLYKGYTQNSNFGAGDKAKGYQNIILFMPEDIGSEMTGQWGAAGWGLAGKALMETAGTKELIHLLKLVEIHLLY